jgi:AraC-like DNA-binding protein
LVDVALALNFSSQANFTRAFRRLTGQTPVSTGAISDCSDENHDKAGVVAPLENLFEFTGGDRPIVAQSITEFRCQQ